MNKKAVFMLILLLALLLRLPHLTDKNPGIDEESTIRQAQFIYSSYSVSWPYVPIPNEETPPLFFHLMAISLSVYNSILSMRIAMVIIGLLSIIVFYMLARKIFNEDFALFSMFLYAINPLHIVYSQHTRVYLLLTLLFPLSLYFLYKFLIEKNSRSLVYLAAVYVISLYSHYHTIWYLLGEGIIVLVFYLHDKKVRFAKYFLSVLIVALLFIPGMLLFVQQFTEYGVVGGFNIMPLLIPVTMFYPLWKYSVMADISTTFNHFPYIALLFPLLVGLAAYGAFLLYKEHKDKFLFIASSFSVPYILYAAAGSVLPIFSFRFITYLLPLYVMLFSYGLFKIKNTMLKMILLFILIAGWCIVISFYYSILKIPYWGAYIAV